MTKTESYRNGRIAKEWIFGKKVYDWSEIVEVTGNELNVKFSKR